MVSSGSLGVLAAREEHGQADPVDPKTRFVSVLAGSALRLGIECHGYTRLTHTSTGSTTGTIVFYSIDKLQLRPFVTDGYHLKEALKTCVYSFDYDGNKQVKGSGTLHDVYPGPTELNLELRSTIQKIEVDWDSDIVKIVSMPANADPDTDHNWVDYTTTTWEDSWTSKSGCGL